MSCFLFQQKLYNFHFEWERHYQFEGKNEKERDIIHG